MTGDWQGEWAERQPPAPPPPHSPSQGRHSRPPEAYDDPGPYAATDRYPQPDPYAEPDPYAAPAPYAGPDLYGQPGPYGDADHFAQPDPYPAPERAAQPDPLTAPGRFAPPDPLTAPGRFAPPDPLTAPGRFAPPDPLAAPGRYAPPDRSAETDPFATRPPRAWAAQESYDPLAGPKGQNGYTRPDAGDALAGPPDQNGYGPPTPYGAQAERRNQNGYGPADYGQPDEGQHGTFRWRPSPDTPEPEGLAPLPGYHGAATHEPGPAPRDWDPGRERGWDQGQDDSSVGLAEPVSGPVDRGAWQREAIGRGEPQRDRWDERNAPSDDGLIPGFGDTVSRRGRGGSPRRRVSRVLAPLLAPLLVLVLLAALGVGGYKIYKHFQSADFTGPGTGEVTVQVLPGDTATSLAPRLVKLGVVASVSSFISAAKDSSNPEGLQPGFFRLRHHMNSALAYRLLLSPAARIQSVVAVPEGLRESQILTAIEQKTGTPASAFTAALRNPAALGLPSYANGNPEGYLFPATYDFNPGTSALTMLKTMVARFNQEAASINLPAAAKAAQLTENQVITVASILEAEAGSPKYYPEVAEVIYNRLNQGMFLGLDSTVNYALHRFGVSLTNAQLHVDSPYNTFIHKGLPPGPIDSPGNAAIEAALHPDHGDLLYFVTVNLKTGLTLFTSSPTQFQQFEQECQQNHAC